MADERPVVANPDFKDIKQDIITYFKNDATFSDYDFFQKKDLLLLIGHYFSCL